MKSRYKLLIDYPRCPYDRGTIIGYDDPIFDEREMDRFPDIFRKLDWWEYLSPEEMPEYVAYDGLLKLFDDITASKLKVMQWMYSDIGWHAMVEPTKNRTVVIQVMHLTPLTKEEYEQ